MTRPKKIAEWVITAALVVVVCCGACLFSFLLSILDSDVPLMVGPGLTDCNRHPELYGNPTVLGGRVLDRQTREPIAGAYVTIRSHAREHPDCFYVPLKELTLRTAENGLFQLDEPIVVALVDQLEVIVTADGCRPASLSYLQPYAFGSNRTTEPQYMLGVTITLSCA